MESAALNEVELSQYCRRKGVYPEQVAGGKASCVKANASAEEIAKANREQSKQDKKRIKKSELRRKEKALAAKAALLVLHKKSTYFGGQRGRLSSHPYRCEALVSGKRQYTDVLPFQTPVRQHYTPLTTQPKEATHDKHPRSKTYPMAKPHPELEKALSNSLKHDELQATVELLQRQITEKDSAIKSYQELLDKRTQLIQTQQDEIAYLQERLAIFLSKRYAAQSEQLRHIQGQLFDEAELEKAISETQEAIQALEAVESPPEAHAKDSVSAKAEKKPTQPKRKKLPDHLRRVEITVDVSEEDKQAMGDDWVCIGAEMSEQLAVQQRSYYVKVFNRLKYVRKEESSKDDASSTGIKVAPPAIVILPRAIADSSLLADVLCSKFIDAMSFYCTDKRLKREGIEIGYSTLCDWPIQLYECMEAFESPFYEAISESGLWHLDETTLQVQGEKDRANTLTSYMWGIRAGPPDKPIILFHYDARRNYEALEAWLHPCLAGFNGVIVTDEHGPYNTLVKLHPNIRAHGGCFAHCRRKFADAAKGRRHDSEAYQILQKIALIYRQENNTAHLDGDEKKAARREYVKPLMDALESYLDDIAHKYIGKGAMNTAIKYARNNWDKFTAFINHPEMPIDNNPMEAAIRPFTLGR